MDDYRSVFPCPLPKRPFRVKVASRPGSPSLLKLLSITLLLLLAGCRRSGFPDVAAGYHEFAYVANSGSNTVTVLDLVAIRPDRTITVADNPVALALSPSRNELYVLSAERDQRPGVLSTIDLATDAVTATIPVGRGPVALALDPAGHRAYVANQLSNSVSVLDLDARRHLTTLPTGKAPSGVAVASDDRTLLVTNAGSGSVSLFSILPIGPPLTLRATIGDCPGATSPVILPNASRAFAACAEGHQVLSLSLALPLNDYNARQDSALTADHALALLDVGQHPTHLTLKPDGGELFASNSTSNSVSEISTYTNEVGGTYPIGNNPAHGVISADGSALWIANAGSESLSLYSIQDGRLASILRTGNAPNALAFSADEHLLLAADSKSGDVALIRTDSKAGPTLFTILPAGNTPTALVIKATQPRP